MLWVPAGFMMAEMSAGGVLLFGIRKTSIVKGASHAERYATLKDMYSAQGMKVTNMEVALNAMAN